MISFILALFGYKLVKIERQEKLTVNLDYTQINKQVAQVDLSDIKAKLAKLRSED